MVAHRLVFKDPAAWVKSFVAMCLLVPLMGVVALSIDVARAQLFNYSHWFDYYSINPVAPPYEIEESLLFESDAVIRRPIMLEWNDVLFCDLYDGLGFRYFSSYHSKRHQVSPRDRMKIMWVYGGSAPKESASCFLHSTISGRLQFSEDKVQEIKGPLFEIELN